MSTNPEEDEIYLVKPDTAFLTKAEITAWEAGKTFSTNWAAGHFFDWAKLLHPHRQKVRSILEIGSWEGRASNFFLKYFPCSRVVCIDTFAGNVEHHRDVGFTKRVYEAEAKFDCNLAEALDRVEKIKGSSATALPKLGIAGRRFDLAYIDGSHNAADVYSDATLTWPMMQAGAIVIFDDYEFNAAGEESERPKVGIDAFLAAFSGDYRVISRGSQLVIGKH